VNAIARVFHWRYIELMVRKLITLAAWATLCLICFATLSPIGLRPGTGSVGLERFAAFALLGMLFVLAYPRHFIRLALFILIVAIGLEAFQHLTPDRHGHLADALVKAAGGLVGCIAARLLEILMEKLVTGRQVGSKIPT
jgi:hypothetical protein